jgi:hypothetical protein
MARCCRWWSTPGVYTISTSQHPKLSSLDCSMCLRDMNDPKPLIYGFDSSVACMYDTARWDPCIAGDLLLYSPAGRRLFPPIRLGCAAAAMATDRGTKLLVLCTDGRLRIWDVQLGTSLLDVSAAPLLSEQGSQGGSVGG